jgi:hypothetical protein
VIEEGLYTILREVFEHGGGGGEVERHLEEFLLRSLKWGTTALALE